jgi:hypothetical protein
MRGGLFSDDLRDFILRCIDSVTQLEGLLLLRANPAEKWDVATVTRRLYANESDVQAALTRLCVHELLTLRDDIYRYEPKSQEARALVDQLAATYAKHLIPVTNMIHDNERHIREFADAFRFRKGR